MTEWGQTMRPRKRPVCNALQMETAMESMDAHTAAKKENEKA